MSIGCSLDLCGISTVDMGTNLEKSPGATTRDLGAMVSGERAVCKCKHFRLWPIQHFKILKCGSTEFPMLRSSPSTSERVYLEKGGLQLND